MCVSTWRKAFLSAVLLLAGCAQVRVASMADVQDVGARVKTKYRYFCIGESRHVKAWLDGDERVDGYANKAFARYQPEVFSDDGIPIGVELADNSRKDFWGMGDGDKFAQFLLTMCCAGFLPSIFRGSEVTSQYKISVAGMSRDSRPLTV